MAELLQQRTSETTTVVSAVTAAAIRDPSTNNRVHSDTDIVIDGIRSYHDDEDDYDFDTPGTTGDNIISSSRICHHPPILQPSTVDTAECTIGTSISLNEDDPNTNVIIRHGTDHGTDDAGRLGSSTEDVVLDDVPATTFHRNFLRPPVPLNDDEQDEEGHPIMKNELSTPSIRQTLTQRTSDKKRGPSSTKKVSQQQPSSPSNPSIKVPSYYTISDHYWEAVLYIGACATIGEVIRDYFERLFGEDCELRNQNDWLTYISDHICITNGGRTEQTGGALFYDLPANILGCFVMGMITPPVRYNYHLQVDDDDDEDEDGTRAYHYHRRTTTRIPWLHRDHPLQVDDVFHTSLGVGLCGALTTFASWNTQMVVMLDGSYTDLGGGNQVATVLFGYFIGLLSCMASFEFGRHYIATWMYDQVHKFRHHRSKDALDMEGNGQVAMTMNVDSINSANHNDQGNDQYQQNDTSIMIRRDDDDQDGDDDDLEEEKANPSARSKHVHKLPLLVMSLLLLIIFAVAARYGNNTTGFYRNMTLAWLFAPVGGLLRWKLTDLNSCRNNRRHPVLKWIPVWIPLGTVLANLIAATADSVVTGLSDRYGIDVSKPWLYAVIYAMNTGFGGSLSTVSTMIKETVLLLEEKRHTGTARPYMYAVGTCLGGMIIGLCVYSTTVRVGGGG